MKLKILSLDTFPNDLHQSIIDSQMVIEVGITDIPGYSIPISYKEARIINLFVGSFQYIPENLDFIERAVSEFKQKDRQYYEIIIKEKDIQINLLRELLEIERKKK